MRRFVGQRGVDETNPCDTRHHWNRAITLRKWREFKERRLSGGVVGSRESMKHADFGANSPKLSVALPCG
jgi:hypothetical protein